MEFHSNSYPFLESLGGWAAVFGTFIGIAFLGSFAIVVATVGPSRGPSTFFSALSDAISELLTLRFRRIYAIASLTIKEAIRRKALVVFVVFAVLFMFAGWFMPTGTERTTIQIKVYVYFVLTVMSWLILPVVLLLSCWGLPEDIRLRSLHTVVTKPARRCEIVMGRILGFSSVGLGVLACMGIAGYVWIYRQVPAELRDEYLVCRVPVHGDLEFRSRHGVPERKGINVGDMWEYRSFIEGATKARAIWTYNGLTEDIVGDGLKFESRFEAFRTHKGRDMRQGLICQLTLVKDVREECFRTLSINDFTRPAADFMREGQFLNAADELESFSKQLSANETKLAPRDLENIEAGFAVSSVAINELDSELTEGWSEPVLAAMKDVGEEAKKGRVALAGSAAGNVDMTPLADSLNAFAGVLREHGSSMRESMAVVRVPMEPFEVQEYRDGDAESIRVIPRELTFEGSEEDVARHLAREITPLAEAGKLISDGALKRDAVIELSESGVISPELAEIVANVLQESITDGTLAISDGKLAPADGRSYFRLFDEFARNDRLSTVSGWQLSADLYDDLVHNGELKVQVAGHSSGQFIGMGTPDLFIRLPDRSFATGYIKAVIGIALMVIIVVSIGVSASCFVKGPVATLLTAVVLLFGGPMNSMLDKIASGEQAGGGIVESVIRIQQHSNPQVGLETSKTAKTAIESIDAVGENMVWIASHLIPDFNHFTKTRQYVESGFDVPWNTAMIPCFVVTIGFLIPCILLGYFSLRFRELEAK